MLKIRNNIYGYFIFLLLFTILSGCASINNVSTASPMTLVTNPYDTGLNNQLVLMTLKIKNNSQLMFKPTVQTISLHNSSRNTVNQYATAVPCRVVNGFKIYLLSFSLPAGNYELNEADGFSDNNGKRSEINIPLHIHFTVGQAGVVYLGSINTIPQKQTGASDLWVGSMSSLVNQPTSGFVGGNYIINISDDYAEDVTDFSNQYPELIDENIVKSILSIQQQQLLEE